MRVDPTGTSSPKSFEELRSWMAIDTARRHRPVWLVDAAPAGGTVNQCTEATSTKGTSVCGKSRPLHRSGSPEARASA